MSFAGFAVQPSIRASLQRLQGIPPLRSRDGITEVLLDRAWHSLDQVRQHLDEKTLATMESRGVPWTWLGGRGATTPSRQGEWTNLLAEDANRSWIVATALCAEIITDKLEES